MTLRYECILIKRAGEKMGYINPLFNDQPIKKDKPAVKTKKIEERQVGIKNKQKTGKVRATRSDKTKNVKFPVDTITQMKLRSYMKLAERHYRMRGEEPLSQTKFNTLLLRFGLQYVDLIQWNIPYQDTKVYMHTNLLEQEYRDIGGPFGFAIEKSFSDRRVVYCIINSVLNWLEGEGDLEKII
jgi:hypothetical protein